MKRPDLFDMVIKNRGIAWVWNAIDTHEDLLKSHAALLKALHKALNAYENGYSINATEIRKLLATYSRGKE